MKKIQKNKTKIKPLSPTLRERKRYLAFEVISEKSLDQKSISKAIMQNTQEFIGTLGASKAGLKFMKFNDQRGLIKVTHRNLDKLRASLSIISQIEGQDVIVQTLGASGTLKKAETYIAG